MNQEQAKIMKDILTKKKSEPNKLVHLFLIGGPRTNKTFTTKALFQSLVHLYNVEMDYNPLQLK
jgi:hypothetical protein